MFTYGKKYIVEGPNSLINFWLGSSLIEYLPHDPATVRSPGSIPVGDNKDGENSVKVPP
jgi:hypothetical protein